MLVGTADTQLLPDMLTSVVYQCLNYVNLMHAVLAVTYLLMCSESISLSVARLSV